MLLQKMNAGAVTGFFFFSEGAKPFFLIFSWREMLFPGRKLVDPKQILVVLKSEKQKKKKIKKNKKKKKKKKKR